MAATEIMRFGINLCSWNGPAPSAGNTRTRHMSRTPATWCSASVTHGQAYHKTSKLLVNGESGCEHAWRQKDITLNICWTKTGIFMGTCCKTICKHRILLPSIQHLAWLPQGRPQGKQKCGKNSDFFHLAHPYQYIMQHLLHCSHSWTSSLRILTKSPAISQQFYKLASRGLSAMRFVIDSWASCSGWRSERNSVVLVVFKINVGSELKMVAENRK